MRASISVLKFFNITSMHIRYSNQNIGQKLIAWQKENRNLTFHGLQLYKRKSLFQEEERKKLKYIKKLNTYNTENYI
jgi:hypothetical protein